MIAPVVRTLGAVILAAVLVPLAAVGAGSSASTAAGSERDYGVRPDGPPLDPSRYVFPLIGPARYGPYHHDYPATDIFVPVGTPVIACVDGQVLHVSRDDIGKGGLSVTLAGADGYTYYYAHLSVVAPAIQAGRFVRRAELLGWSGHSGNARYTEPHLHFGISKNGNVAGEFSPYPYLQAWPRLAA